MGNRLYRECHCQYKLGCPNHEHRQGQCDNLERGFYVAEWHAVGIRAVVIHRLTHEFYQGTWSHHPDDYRWVKIPGRCHIGWNSEVLPHQAAALTASCALKV